MKAFEVPWEQMTGLKGIHVKPVFDCMLYRSLIKRLKPELDISSKKP